MSSDEGIPESGPVSPAGGTGASSVSDARTRLLAEGERIRLGDIDSGPGDDLPSRREVEPYLAALLQAEHLNMLVGAGLTTALANAAGAEAGPDMSARLAIPGELGDAIEAASVASTARTARGDDPNLEDRLRIALTVLAGLEVVKDKRAAAVREGVERAMSGLRDAIANVELGIKDGATEVAIEEMTVEGLLVAFLGSFAGRAPTRDRLHVFTTNYDRVIEWGAERGGLRAIDRFVGSLEPVFRSSRLELDIHYSPPGTIREPRHLDGVMRLTKLHGSLDWRWIPDQRQVVRAAVPFGTGATGDSNELLIFPNAAKDFETTFYPYSELSRDFSAALCRPHSVLVTYGYSFGDDHLNRVISDMLTIPSTHLLVISYDDQTERIARFIANHRRSGQVSHLIGPVFGALPELVSRWLPAPSAEFLLQRRATIFRSRNVGQVPGRDGDAG